MSRARTFASWLSSLTTRTAGIRVELGAKSQAGATLGILAIAGRKLELSESAYMPEEVELAELATHIEELARAAGWPDEEPKMRLYALDAKGRNITSWQKTERTTGPAASKSDTVIMFEQMADILSRQLSTIEKLVSTQSASIESLSDANSHAMNTTIHMIDGMIESREYAADTAAANAYLETVMTDGHEAEESPFVGLARDALASIGMAQEPAGEEELDIDAIRKRAEEDQFFRMDLENLFKAKEDPKPEEKT